MNIIRRIFKKQKADSCNTMPHKQKRRKRRLTKRSAPKIIWTQALKRIQNILQHHAKAMLRGRKSIKQANGSTRITKRLLKPMLQIQEIKHHEMILIPAEVTRPELRGKGSLLRDRTLTWVSIPRYNQECKKPNQFKRHHKQTRKLKRHQEKREKVKN